MTRRDRADDAAGDDAADRTREPDREPPGDATPDADSPPSSADPRRIGSVAVTESDVVDALEAAARGGREIVLRVTPPFSGRMRARLHDAGVVDADDDSGMVPERGAGTADDQGREPDTAAPVHIPPERFVADPPTYPTVDDTEDELRASEAPYTRERHRERHQAAVEEWRAAVRERLLEEVTVSTAAGSTTVSVAYLG
jgi:hypothetical protein